MKIKNIKRIIAEESELEITGATLLTVEEAKKLPRRLRMYSRWWWLKTRGYLSCNATLVSQVGYINECGSDISFDGAIRPALKISYLESSGLKIGDTFEFDGKQFEIISDDKAFCLQDIGECYFNHFVEGELGDFNDYEKSYIKNYVDDWFKWSIRESKR